MNNVVLVQIVQPAHDLSRYIPHLKICKPSIFDEIHEISSLVEFHNEVDLVY